MEGPIERRQSNKNLKAISPNKGLEDLHLRFFHDM